MLVCKYFLVNCGDCGADKEKEKGFLKLKHPQIQAGDYCLSPAPSPGASPDHLEDSLCPLAMTEAPSSPISITNTELGRTLVRPRRSTSLCFRIRLYFWERKRTEGGRNNKSSFALRCAHVFSDGFLIISSSISPLSPFSNNSNKCQIWSQLMKCTPIKWPKWKNGPPWFPALRPSCNACFLPRNQMIFTRSQEISSKINKF